MDDPRLVERKTVLLHVMMGLLQRFKVGPSFFDLLRLDLTLVG